MFLKIEIKQVQDGEFAHAVSIAQEKWRWTIGPLCDFPCRSMALDGRLHCDDPCSRDNTI